MELEAVRSRSQHPSTRNTAGCRRTEISHLVGFAPIHVRPSSQSSGVQNVSGLHLQEEAMCHQQIGKQLEGNPDLPAYLIATVNSWHAPGQYPRLQRRDPRILQWHTQNRGPAPSGAHQEAHRSTRCARRPGTSKKAIHIVQLALICN